MFVSMQGKEGVVIYDDLARKTPVTVGTTYAVPTGGKMHGICITPDESWILGDSKAGIIKVRAEDKALPRKPPALGVYVMYGDKSTVAMPESIVMLPGGLYASCNSVLHEVHMLCESTNTNWTLAGNAVPGFVARATRRLFMPRRILQSCRMATWLWPTRETMRCAALRPRVS